LFATAYLMLVAILASANPKPGMISSELLAAGILAM